MPKNRKKLGFNSEIHIVKELKAVILYISGAILILNEKIDFGRS